MILEKIPDFTHRPVSGFYINLGLLIISSQNVLCFIPSGLFLVCFSVPWAYKAHSGLWTLSTLPKTSSLRCLGASFFFFFFNHLCFWTHSYLSSLSSSHTVYPPFIFMILSNHKIYITDLLAYLCGCIHIYTRCIYKHTST